MRHLTRLCASLILCATATGALAAAPSTPASDGTAAASDGTAAPTTKPVVTEPAADASAAKGGLTDVDVRRAFAKYRRTVREGETVYCRVEKPLGTRIGKSVCVSEDVVLARARAERDAQNLMSQRGVCASANAACVAP